MSETDPSPTQSQRRASHIPALPRANAVVAVIVAIASLGAAVTILTLVPDDAGKAAAGAIATAGLALAGRLGTPGR
ncbi:hypothetical protein J2X68_000868 [Streptomyces sp. 3330]|uniref:hypothetical protein n=1 Tax=Streptomyces sp. 3330 TaxID=2817755 RepID=UPI002860ECA7|nr:hypothetical protein [Streptomyces sp. 3330]MDR6974190.1 hypothetical protein [Streptomyces sp. 3330]